MKNVIHRGTGAGTTQELVTKEDAPGITVGAGTFDCVHFVYASTQDSDGEDLGGTELWIPMDPGDDPCGAVKTIKTEKRVGLCVTTTTELQKIEKK
jgi:hypothetical protein